MRMRKKVRINHKATPTLVLTIAGFALSGLSISSQAWGQDCMMSEVRAFSGNFAPKNWAIADGQILDPQKNKDLFALIGTIYGGDGRTTFALPDLQGRIAAGASTENAAYKLGAKFGTETIQLTPAQLPAHTHNATLTTQWRASTEFADNFIPSNHYIATVRGGAIYSTQAGSTLLSPNAYTASSETGTSGDNAAISNMQPSLPLNYIICIDGAAPIYGDG